MKIKNLTQNPFIVDEIELKKGHKKIVRISPNEIVEVRDEVAKKLLEDYPHSFVEAAEPKPKAEAKAKSEK